MKTIFRQIRRSLNESRGNRKYLLYALGELALVVAGILIALAANSAFEKMREQQDALRALHSLQSDVSHDLSQLENYWYPQMARIKEGRARLEGFLRSNSPIIDSVQFVSDVFWLGIYTTFDPRTSTIEELKSTNRISLISNNDLRSAMLDYQNNIENVAEFDIVHRSYFLELNGRLATKVLGGFALARSIKAEIENDLDLVKEEAGKALDASFIRSSDYLRELLESTGTPFYIKELEYRRLGQQAKQILDLIDKELI